MKKVNVFLLSLALTCMLALPAYATTGIYSNFGGGDSYGTLTWSVAPGWVASEFTVDPPGFSDILVDVAVTVNTAGGALNVEIWYGDANHVPTLLVPGASTSVNPPTNPSHGIETASFPTLTLNPGTYQVVVRPGPALGAWYFNNQDIEGVASSSDGGSWNYFGPGTGQLSPAFRVQAETTLPVELSVFKELDPGELPGAFALQAACPNPFNPSTLISYALPQPSEVTLAIYNLRGQQVATLVSGSQPAGTYQMVWDASGFANGVYFYTLTAGEYSATKRMVLIK